MIERPLPLTPPDSQLSPPARPDIDTPRRHADD